MCVRVGGRTCSVVFGELELELEVEVTRKQEIRGRTEGCEICAGRRRVVWNSEVLTPLKVVGWSLGRGAR